MFRRKKDAEELSCGFEEKQKKVAECKRLPPLYYIGILLFHEGVFHMAIAAKEIGHIHPFLSGQLQRQHTQEAIG